MPEWVVIVTLVVSVFATLSPVMLYIHRSAGQSRRQFQDDMEAQIYKLRTDLENKMDRVADKVSTQAAKEHAEMREQLEAVRTQVNDFRSQVSEGYIRTREFESALHAVNESITQGRREIGGVANNVIEIGRRVDRLHELARGAS